MSCYIEDQETASALIAEYGVLMTLSQETAGGYDPATGSLTTSTNTYPAYGVKLGYKRPDIDGTLVKVGDMKVLLSVDGLTVEPSTTDTLTIGGIDWKILRVDPLEPGDTTIMYTLQVRK